MRCGVVPTLSHRAVTQLPDNVAELARAGAVGVLQAEQDFSPKLKRQRVEVALARIATTLQQAHADVVATLPPAEQALIAELAAAEAEAAKQPLHAVRASLIESGVLLYLHTAGGGAAWGLFESLRQVSGGSTAARCVRRKLRWPHRA